MEVELPCEVKGAELGWKRVVAAMIFYLSIYSFISEGGNMLHLELVWDFKHGVVILILILKLSLNG